jgi:hypothetical protein
MEPCDVFVVIPAFSENTVKLLYRPTRGLERGMAEKVRAAAIRDAQLNPQS